MIAAPPNMLPALAGLVLAPVGGALLSPACTMPAMVMTPEQRAPYIRRCAIQTSAVLGVVAAASAVALYHPRTSPTFRSAALGALVGSTLLAGYTLARMPKKPPAIAPQPPPAAMTPLPPPAPPPAAPPPTPPPAAGPNYLGCTPVTTSLPESALAQARALLNLSTIEGDPQGRPLATPASIAEMRRLADALAYCGSELEAGGAIRDDYVRRLRDQADLYERNIPKPPAATGAFAGPPPNEAAGAARDAYRRWIASAASSSPDPGAVRSAHNAYVARHRAAYQKDPPDDGTPPP